MCINCKGHVIIWYHSGNKYTLCRKCNHITSEKIDGYAEMTKAKTILLSAVILALAVLAAVVAGFMA